MHRLALLFLLPLVACQPPAEQGVDLRSGTPEAVVRGMYAYYADAESIWYDEAAFYAAHNDEILQTLEVVEVTPWRHSLAAVFVRYSVGSRVFRDVRWVREVEGSWVLSTYNIGYGISTREDAEALALRDRINEWTDGSARMWME